MTGALAVFVILIYPFFRRYDMPQTQASTAGSTTTTQSTPATAGTVTKLTPGSPRIIQTPGSRQPVKVITSGTAQVCITH